MAEEEVKEEPKEDGEPEQGSQDMITKAEATAIRIEEATKKLKEENDRTERLMVQNKLGGSSEAGQEPEKPKEETPQEYAARVMKGESKSE